MHINAIKTNKVEPRIFPIENFLDSNLHEFSENSVFVITSKVVALCEGRFMEKDKSIRSSVIEQEADYYLSAEESPYGIPITIKDNAFIAKAGIDGGNTHGVYSLLPEDSYRTSREIRSYLCNRFKIKNVGVIIVDSHSTPLRRGTLGVAIGWSGFQGLKDYRNVPDIFGQLFTTHANHVDALACAAVFAMGEGNEQTPIVTLHDIPLLTFSADSPTEKELDFFKPPLEEDLFAPLLHLQLLKKGKGK